MGKDGFDNETLLMNALANKRYSELNDNLKKTVTYISEKPIDDNEIINAYKIGGVNKTDLVIELGLQTIHDKTAKLINRGSTLEEFEYALKKLNERNIDVVVHIINGLPYETKEMMIETAKYLSNKIFSAFA